MTLRNLIQSCCGKHSNVTCTDVLLDLEVQYDVNACLFPIMKYFLSYQFVCDQRNSLLDFEDACYNRLMPYLSLKKDKDGAYFIKLYGEPIEDSITLEQ